MLAYQRSGIHQYGSSLPSRNREVEINTRPQITCTRSSRHSGCNLSTRSTISCTHKHKSKRPRHTNAQVSSTEIMHLSFIRHTSRQREGSTERETRRKRTPPYALLAQQQLQTEELGAQATATSCRCRAPAGEDQQCQREQTSENACAPVRLRCGSSERQIVVDDLNHTKPRENIPHLLKNSITYTTALPLFQQAFRPP